MRITENEKLWKIINKGPNYRKPKTTNWKNINESYGKLKESHQKKIGESLIPWNSVILTMDQKAILKLTTRIKLYEDHKLYGNTQKSSL